MRILKETKNGWYIHAVNWNRWRISDGSIEPLAIMWSLGAYKIQNPKYIQVTIFGFGLEIGKYEKGKS